ncbi:hypothetical protein FB567DRAFT_113988 [Paraphoma chrysanthemicola]|uniref:F-box domain-containing protein n=1 Tax=Paraphoma chrysanthemicola TaxID=798071 RepID=A0A8K0QZ30_9PLEO|nr:hypothetical protein FB567DRAFT_113988 [Paraphoma chrysanthemicola]
MKVKKEQAGAVFQPSHSVLTSAARTRDLIRSEDAFRFLDLPGELRNRIYQLVDVTPGLVTLAIPANPRIRRIRGTGYSSRLQLRGLALTQVCREIRGEFRPLLLRDVVVSLRDIEMYVHAFVEQPKMNYRRAFGLFHDKIGIIQISLSSYSEVDVLYLLRLKARHPDSRIKLCPHAGYGKISSLCERFFNNSNQKWKSWICNGTISQVRLRISSPVDRFSSTCLFFYIVFRTHRIPHWIEELGLTKASASKEILASIGLDTPDTRVEFGLND